MPEEVAPPAQSVFASRDFRRFYLGQAASYAGDGLRTVALPLLVFQLTGSALNLGITFALELGPFAVFSLVGGSLADRLDRKRLMIACDAMRLMIMVSFALAYRAHALTLPWLYGGIVLHSICGAFFNGGQASSVPYLLGKSRAVHAVAALASAEYLVGAIAPPLGGAIFSILGAFPALAIDAATYAISLLSLSTLRGLGPETAGSIPGVRTIAADIGRGFRFLQTDTPMRVMAGASFALNLVGTIGWVALVPFVERDLGGNATAVGILFGGVGLGAGIGSTIAPRLRSSTGTVIWTSFLGGALAFLVVPFARDLATAIVFNSLSAVSAGINISVIIAWRMRVIPEDFVGRVFGAVRLTVLCGTLPGALIGGALADAYGARTSEFVSAIGTLALTLWLASRRTIRLERR